MHWWTELGFPDAFDLGRDGFFPRPGQVVKYYRERKMNDKGKSWTQKNLAKTLELTDNGVRDIENRDVGMDDFGRRQFLCKLFGIPPLLLGIMMPGEVEALLEKQRNAISAEPHSAPSTASRKHVLDIKEYQDQFAGLWTASLAEQSPLATALAIVDELYRELPHATQERTQIQGLLCDYHQLIAMELCDQRNYDAAIEHLNKAFRLAEFEDEQKALVFKRRGDTLWKGDRIDEALDDFERAWQFEKNLPNNLRGSILDEEFLATLKKHLQPLVRREWIIIRTDREDISPGIEREQAIKHHLWV